jgi:hypothetical protein
VFISLLDSNKQASHGRKATLEDFDDFIKTSLEALPHFNNKQRNAKNQAHSLADIEIAYLYVYG